MWGKSLLSIGLLLIFLPLHGQLNLSGTVLSRENGQPIPYVNIWITGLPYGTSTNDDGTFELKVPGRLDPGIQTVSFSCIGFYPREIAILELTSNGVVELISSITQLSELVVFTEKVKRKNGMVARKLVQKALSKIPTNYPKKPFLLNTFYRHYCSENDNYVRLIEAAVDVYSPRNNFKLEQKPDDRLAFKITQLRRSFDFTENARLFHPSISLNYLWSNDLTDFAYHNPLSGDLKNFNFIIADTTNYGQDRVYLVEFEPSPGGTFSSQSRYRGKLYIKEADYAFIRTEITETKINPGIIDSVHSQIKKISGYKDYQGKYYPDRFTNQVNVLYASIDPSKAVLDSLRHRSRIEMISNNIQIQDLGTFEGKEPDKMDMRKIKYDSTFWNRYTVLKATALEEQIIADLSSKISLQKQFESFNTIDGGGMSITDSKLFRDLLEAHQGSPLYLVLWSNWGHLNHIDLKPVKYFRRMLRKKQVKLLLVAVEHDQHDWMNHRQYFGLNLKYIDHARLDLGFDSGIAKSYLNNVFPYFLSVDRQGTNIYRHPPLPNDEEVKPFIKALINDRLVAVPIAKE